MSRIGNRQLIIPEQTTVAVETGLVTVTGPKGSLQLKTRSNVVIEVADNKVTTKPVNQQKATRQLYGTYNSLIKSMLEGVTKGFSKELIIKGVGYKAQLQGKKLTIALGFSHKVNITIPDNINLTLPSPTHIIVAGIDKQAVGEMAAVIRSFKKPEPYKGKGIRYKDEHVVRKVGKTAGK